jgi:uncharacterized membrane protein YdjX (TVP38/TMEM64 family)
LTAVIAPLTGRRLAAWVVAFVMAGAATAVAFGFDLGVALEILHAHHGGLLSFVAEAPVQASILFMILYAAAVVISVPGVAILTVIAGYLFGWLHGSVLVVVAVTVAASGLFLLARSALGDHVRERAAPAVQRFGEGFRRHALSYGFALNVLPVFPYALIIVVPAACGVPLHTFLGGMLLGLVPGTFVFAGLGDRLEEVLSPGATLQAADFVTTEILLLLTGLAALALLPVVGRAWGRRASAPGGPDKPI